MKESNVAERLKEIMDEQNLRQVDIRKKCEQASINKDYGEIKITKVDISSWLIGKYSPSAEKLVLLADSLGVNESWLLGFDVPRKRQKCLKQ